MSLDLAPALRDALIDAPTIYPSLASWQGEPAVHTRRPVPPDSGYPMIVVSPDVAITDEDGLNSDRPVVVRDILIYGQQPAHYRTVESLGYAVRGLFHRARNSLSPAGYHVIDVRAQGPFPAPTDDENTVARAVSLTIRLRRTP